MTILILLVLVGLLAGVVWYFVGTASGTRRLASFLGTAGLVGGG